MDNDDQVISNIPLRCILTCPGYTRNVLGNCFELTAKYFKVNGYANHHRNSRTIYHDNFCDCLFAPDNVDDVESSVFGTQFDIHASKNCNEGLL